MSNGRFPSSKPRRLTRLSVPAFALACLALGACDDDDVPGVDAAPVDAAGPGTDTSTVPPDGGVAVDTAAPSEAGTPDGGAADTAPGTDAAPPPPADTDYVVVRLNANGTPDPTFGQGGIARHDLSSRSGNARDFLWTVATDPQGRLVLFGAVKGSGSDNDRAVVRLLANGALDTTFAEMGVHRLNIAGLNDNARSGFVQADGKIVSSGYTAQPTGVGTQSANKVVLARLLDTGMPDMTFGVNGIVNSAPFVPANPTTMEWGMAEAYGVTAQSTGAYVTTGYGRSAPSGTVDMVSFRYLADGTRDMAWGTSGVALLDLVGQNDRGRAIATLPGDRILIVGTGTPVMGNGDALAVILTSAGALDATFDADGYKLYSFDRPDEQFFGAALAPSQMWAAAVGYRAGEAAGVMEDDDATLLLLPLGAGAEVAKPVPLSETEDDRFYGVAFGPDGKVYAAGYVTQAGDSWMAVARYNADGTPDATFGTAGVARINATAGGGDQETARSLVVLPDGKIVVGGIAEHQ